MTDKLLTGKWEGYYAYGPQYSEKKQKEREVFYAEILSEDGVLSGTSEEFVTRELMGAPATLSGFIEGNVISFIKQYPFYYNTNDADELVVDRTRQHPPIHYSGLCDLETGVLSGEWELEMFLDRDEHGEDPYLLMGTWELRRV